MSFYTPSITKDVESSPSGAAADISKNRTDSTEDAAPSSDDNWGEYSPCVGDAANVAASDTKQNLSTSSSTIRNPDFPFFRERREPWYWLNIIAFCACFASFLYFTVIIIQDFIRNRNDPPTSTTLRNGLSQSFPAMAFCIHRGIDKSQPDLKSLYASFDNADDNLVDITDQLKPIDCKSDPQNHKCWYLDGTYPAFDIADCIKRNGISVGFTFNRTEYSRGVQLLGIDGFLFEPQDRDTLFGLACRNEGFKCAGGMIPRGDKCQGLEYESFFATTSTTNLIQLHRSESEVSVSCDAKIVRWNHVTAAVNTNPNFLGDQLNVTISDSASTVLMDFQFFSADIKHTTFAPQSGVSLFGSLGEWFGFLSDGWGLLSLLFIIEEIINYFFFEAIYVENLFARYERVHLNPKGNGMIPSN